MAEWNIRLAPIELPQPRTSRIPYNHALRWLSSGEIRGQNPPVTVFVTQRAFIRFCAHAGTDLDNEVGGWLIGKWRTDHMSGKQFIVIEAIVPAQHTRQGSAFLTFTQDSQVAMYDDVEERFPDKDLVGWFHTHPKMGVFLSEYDIWLHTNFFPQPWQVALVIEPHSASGGFFMRSIDNKLDSKAYFGFYELADRAERSVVHWRNLVPDNLGEKGEFGECIREVGS